MAAFGKLSIITLVIYFILYLGIHYFIGLKKKKVEEEFLEKPGNGHLEREYKKWTNIFKWFPAIYVIIIVLLMVL